MRPDGFWSRRYCPSLEKDYLGSDKYLWTIEHSEGTRLWDLGMFYIFFGPQYFFSQKFFFLIHQSISESNPPPPTSYAHTHTCSFLLLCLLLFFCTNSLLMHYFLSRFTIHILVFAKKKKYRLFNVVMLLLVYCSRSCRRR